MNRFRGNLQSGHAAFRMGEDALGLKGALKHAVLGCVASAERFLAPVGQVPLKEYKNCLLLHYMTALGTAVHATPLIRALHDAQPNTSIAVAADSFTLPLIAHHPVVDRVIATPSPLTDLRVAANVLRGAKPFAGEPFLAIAAVGNERTRIALATLMSGAGARVGFTEAPELYQMSLEFDPRLSLIDNNLRIVEALGNAFRHYEPEVHFREEDLHWA